MINARWLGRQFEKRTGKKQTIPQPHPLPPRPQQSAAWSCFRSDFKTWINPLISRLREHCTHHLRILYSRPSNLHSFDTFFSISRCLSSHLSRKQPLQHRQPPSQARSPEIQASSLGTAVRPLALQPGCIKPCFIRPAFHLRRNQAPASLTGHRYGKAVPRMQHGQPVCERHPKWVCKKYRFRKFTWNSEEQEKGKITPRHIVYFGTALLPPGQGDAHWRKLCVVLLEGGQGGKLKAKGQGYLLVNAKIKARY